MTTLTTKTGTSGGALHRRTAASLGGAQMRLVNEVGADVDAILGTSDRLEKEAVACRRQVVAATRRTHALD